MIQVEANACAKPVIAIQAMGFLDTMVHGKTAFLANVAEERKICEAVFGEGHGIDDSHRIVFPNPLTAEYLMDKRSLASIDEAKEAALRVLLHNARGPFQGLPRTAGWG